MRAAIWISFDSGSIVKHMKNKLIKLFFENFQEKEFIHGRYISIIGLILSLGLIYGVWSFSERFFYNQAKARFERHVDKDIQTLRERLQQYENTLRGGIGFFQASTGVTRRAWYHYINTIDLPHYYPGMLGMGYAMMIPQGEIRSVEERIRREGYTGFEVKPKGSREYYSAILYLEPLERRNKAAIGYDMFSEPIRREAMERARDTGQSALTGKVTLLQEIDKEKQAGVLMYLPYYLESKEMDSVEKRRRGLLGYIYAPFRIGDFIHANFTHKEILELEIYDGKRMGRTNLLYRSPDISGYDSDHHTERILRIGGREWHMYYSSSSAFDARHSSQYPKLFALIGLILYLMMMYIIIELLRKRALLKKQTQALQHEKELAQTYLDIAAVMVLIFDTKYTIKSINRKGCEVIGYSADEAIGKNFIELFVPLRIREELHKVANEFVDHNKNDYYENPILTKNGDERLIAWRNRQLFDEQGELIGILSSGEDITDIRHAQKELQERETFYRTIFESIDKSIIILSDTIIVDCNKVALDLFDSTNEHFIGQSLFDTAYEIDCQDGSLHHHLTCAYSGERVSTRCTLRHHENPNNVKIADFYFSQFGSAEQNKLIMIAHDITDKIEKEKMLTLHGRQAQMGEMISMIAHQWRQPLAIINAITTQMRFKAIMNDIEDHTFIDNLVKIEQQSSHLSQTISDYRDFFRPDKPKEHFRIVSLINHAHNLIDHTLKNHSIHVEQEELYNPMLYTYRNEVLQVLIVLLKNALDAFVENKVLGGKITISVRAEERYCIVSVTDDAGGIPSGVMHKLFSPYFTTKSESYGTGLGLYMSRIIIEEHCDGLIEAFSEENTTTFTIKLPCEEEL